MRERHSHFLKDSSGGSLAEFAMVVPVFIGLVFGIIHFSYVVYAQATLNAAVEAAARCISLGTDCTDSTTTTSYASSHYQGPNVGQVFAYSAPTTGSCANMKKVSATGAYKVNVVVTSITINLSARSCYP
ncbi:MAG TPA: TadE/TadG family type IV pilus assembly protein [Caulobacteraceae bacterium]|jgi:Flp pilus assembly protein TadG